jgi:hypothetical protein
MSRTRRTRRLALFGALLLIVALSGTALATLVPRDDSNPAPLAASAEPGADEADEAEVVDPADLAHAADRLAANGIEADGSQLAALAERYGVGGAVRVLAWADQTGRSVDEIAALRDGDGETPGLGWGRIAKELEVHPGIGSIMGTGNGNGHDDDEDADGD